MDLSTIFVIVVAALLASQYVVAPLIFLIQFRTPSPITLPLVPWESFVAEQPSRFKSTETELLRLGFAPTVATRLLNVSEGLYHLPGDACSASVMIGRNHVVVEFTQYFDDGVVLCVTNSPLPKVFPPWDQKLHYRLPRTTSPEALLGMFKRIRARVADRTPVQVPVTAAERLARSQTFLRREMENLVSRGFYGEPTPRGRPVSLKGAYLMVWKLAWPVKPILNALDQTRGEKAAAR